MGNYKDFKPGQLLRLESCGCLVLRDRNDYAGDRGMFWVVNLEPGPHCLSDQGEVHELFAGSRCWVHSQENLIPEGESDPETLYQNLHGIDNLISVRAIVQRTAYAMWHGEMLDVVRSNLYYLSNRARHDGVRLTVRYKSDGWLPYDIFRHADESDGIRFGDLEVCGGSLEELHEGWRRGQEQRDHKMPETAKG